MPLKDRYHKAKKAQSEIWNKLQVAIEEHSEIKKKLDIMNKEWSERQESTKVDEKKIELIGQGVEGIKKKMDALVNKYYETEDAYYQQQKLIKKIEWMTREKERAVRFEKIRKEREEEEKAKIPPHPYQAELDTCDQLISYCKKFIVEKKEDVKKPGEKAENKALQSKITKGELVVVQDKKKKEEEGMIVIGAKKKKKDKIVKEKMQTKKATEAKFDVDLGTLSMFDKVQIQPLLQPKNISITLAKVQERKKYYQELPKVEEAKKSPVPEVKADAIAEPKKESSPTVPEPTPAKEEKK